MAVFGRLWLLSGGPGLSGAFEGRFGGLLWGVVGLFCEVSRAVLEVS